MAEELSGESTVKWTVRELFEQQNVILRDISNKVDTKADKADLVPLMTRLDNHHQRIQSIEDARREAAAGEDARRTTRKWIWGVTTAIVVPIGVALILVFVH